MIKLGYSVATTNYHELCFKNIFKNPFEPFSLFKEGLYSNI